MSRPRLNLVEVERRRVVNLADYDAITTGLTDTTAAFSAAMAAANDGDTIYAPAGRYLLSSCALTGAKNLRWLGETGTVFLHSSSATDSMFTTGADTNDATLMFEGIVFDGNKSVRSARYGDIVRSCSLIAAGTFHKTVIVRNCTFTNSVRAAICAEGSLEVYESHFTGMNESDGTNATYSIFAQPNSTGCWITVENCHFRAASTEAATLHLQAGGIFITEGATAGHVLDALQINGNRFWGIGQYSGGILLDPIRVYNGAINGRISGNYINGFCYGGIGVQRADNFIIESNHIRNGSNAIDNLCFGIFFTPQAREGSAPFTGGRLGEKHQNCIVRNNVIENVKGYGIYSLGQHVTIEGNILDGVTASDGGTCQPITVSAKDNKVIGNIIRRCAKNDIFISGAERTLVKNNTVIDDGAVKTDLAIGVINSIDTWLENNIISFAAESAVSAYYISDSTNTFIRDCYARYAGAGLTVRDGALNTIAIGNQFPDCTTETSIAAGSVCYCFDNSDQPPFTFRRDTNGTFAVYAKNKTALGAPLAAAVLGVEANDASGYIGSFPSDFGDAQRRGKMVLGTDSEADGITVHAPFAGQTLNGIIGGATETFRFDAGASAGTTRFWLYDVDGGGLYRVKTGANNTGPGGAGRALFLDNI